MDHCTNREVPDVNRPLMAAFLVDGIRSRPVDPNLLNGAAEFLVSQEPVKVVALNDLIVQRTSSRARMRTPCAVRVI